MRIEPRAEWQQIFDEAWRINRDYFYDPNMHGADWPAMKKKYEAFLPHLATRGDLVPRHPLDAQRTGRRPQLHAAPASGCTSKDRVRGGLLGADYEIADGRYRFKKVYGGLNWTPELRSPLTAPGVDVKAGEYLLAVRGVDLKPPTEVYSLFENTAGKSDRDHRRPERRRQGQPHGHGRAARQRGRAAQPRLGRGQPEEGPRRRPTAAWPTSTCRTPPAPGHEYFKRYFFPQADKDAIIVDERFNGGGQVADYYIDHLRRPFTATGRRATARTSARRAARSSGRR